MSHPTSGPAPAGNGPATGHAYSHGEGTTSPGTSPEAQPRGEEHLDGDGHDLRNHLPLEDIYGGRAEVAGYEDQVQGASEDAAG